MNTALLITLMILAAIIMAALPFAILMGLGSIVGIDGTDFRMIAGCIIYMLIASYIINFGSFALLQKSSCGEVKNFGQIAANAGISLAFLGGALFFMIFPAFRNIVIDILPPDFNPVVELACVFAYYAAWATALGFAFGGTLSSSCAKPFDATFTVPEEVPAPAGAIIPPQEAPTPAPAPAGSAIPEEFPVFAPAPTGGLGAIPTE